MKLLEVSGAVRPIYGSLGVKRLKRILQTSLVKIWNESCLHVVVFVRFYDVNESLGSVECGVPPGKSGNQ